MYKDISEGIAGKIIVGASATRGSLFIPRLFAKQKADYPKVDLILKEGSNAELLQMVASHEVDLAFVGYSQKGLASIPILDDHIVLAIGQDTLAGKPFADGEVVDIRAFQKEPFILLTSGQAIRNLSERIFSDFGISANIAYETKSYNTAVRMVEMGLGCTFSTSLARRETPDIKLLDLKDPQGKEYSYPLMLVYPSQAYLSPAMKQLIRHSIQIGRELADTHKPVDSKIQ